MTNFFNKLQIDGCKIQFGEVNNVLVEAPYNKDYDLQKYMTDDFLLKNNNKNLYFLAGVNNNCQGRAKDSDILSINHIAFDFDNVTIGEAEVLLDNLRRSYLSGFNFALHSGGGVHINYFFDPIAITPEEFSIKMNKLCKEMDDKSGFETDKACTNIGRIMRIPGSNNVKRGVETNILFEQWDEYQLILDIADKIEDEIQPHTAPEIHINAEGTVDEVINSIPVESLMIKLMSEIHGQYLTFVTELGHFKDSSGKEKAFFKGRDKNVIFSGGSDWIPKPVNGTGYGSFGLVREMLGIDSAQAYIWFNDNFEEVKVAEQKSRDNYINNRNIGGDLDDMPGHKDGGKLPPPLKKVFTPISLNDIVTKNYGEYTYIVDKLIPRVGITIIGGAPKSGKSWLTLYIMSCIASGIDVFRRKTTKVKMLVIDEENSLRGLKRRAEKAIKDINKVPLFVVSQQNFKVDKKEDREWLIEYMKAEGIELLVFDSFRRISTKDENESKSIAELYENFKEIMLATGCGILLIHHNRKVSKGEVIGFESFRGSGDIGAMAEAMIVVNSKRLDNMNGKQSVLIPELRESPETCPFIVDWYDDADGNIVFEYKGEVEEGKTKLEEAVSIMRKFFVDKNSEYSRDMLKIEIGQVVGKNNIDDAAESLVSSGYLKKRIGTRNKVFYSLINMIDFSD